MENCFFEENEIVIDGEYDVVVVGGGIAGVSSALAARRAGCRTLIIEKSVMLGGLATLGFIAWYLPLCDGKGRKVVGGIAEELLRLAIKYGYDTLPPEWASGSAAPGSTSRYQTRYSPAEFVIALDELMEQEGIEVIYDTVFCSAVMEDGICRGVIVENKSGRQGFGAKVFVDATGDADIMARAGARCAEGDNWLSYWTFSTNLDRMKEAVDRGDVAVGIHLQWWGGLNDGRGAPQSAAKYRGTGPREITRFVTDGRRMLRDGLDKSKAREQSLLALPGMAQVRTTRRICGYYELSEKDIFTHFADSIGSTGDWRKPGPIFEIPYRTLISPGISNIITAGRTIAAGGDAWEVTRVIPPASMTGQAAGTAAALAAFRGCDLNEVDIPSLQHELTQKGVMIHF